MTDRKLCHMCWERDKPGTVYVHNRGEFNRLQCCGDCLARADRPWRIALALDVLVSGSLVAPFLPFSGMCFSCKKWCIARYNLKMMRGALDGGFLGGWPTCRQCYERAVELSRNQLLNDSL